ncbi:unnamed protein product [Musa acuminata subsp. malaccensis]|uniref:(wild Malaysian banana) hypothetical protein n=1 Tax=Musa acuminata subsp. malaccensis TaxID=214687 RepID=A0A804K4M7_MUSAM|nr:unnamed protein product [Musa acuminata subsp. malaccensis]
MYFAVNSLLYVHFIWMEYSGWKTCAMLHAASLVNGGKTINYPPMQRAPLMKGGPHVRVLMSQFATID